MERPSDKDRELLKQRRLRWWLERQREAPPSGHLCARNLEEDVQRELSQFLDRAKDRCSDEEFNGRVLEETLALMQGWACFEMLETEGDSSDWKSQRPLGISCAATLLAGDKEPILWFGGNEADRMNREEAAKLVEYLSKQVANDYTLVTWNGLGFDLDILAEESDLLQPYRELASNHVDLMFHVVCRLDYGVSLDAAAKGMELAGKPEGMNGAKAPVLWAEGKREDVLRYVAQDVRTTLDLAA